MIRSITRKPGARRFVAVGRADAALGGADLVLAFERLALRVQLAVIGKHQVRGFAEEQVAVDLDPELAQPSISSTRLTGSTTTPLPMTHILFLRRMPGRDQVQDVFLPFDEDRVPGVVAALRAHDDVRLLGQHVDDFAFAFIAPLGADQNRIGHNSIKIPERMSGAKGSAFARRN